MNFSFGQENTIRKKEIRPGKDTLVLDTLSIVSSEFRLLGSDGQSINENAYHLNPFTAELILKWNLIQDTLLTTTYRTYPLNFAKIHSNKDTNIIYKYDRPAEKESFLYTAKTYKDDFFSASKLKKNGSISRGITFGNNQNLSVNSTLNLQLTGEITKNLYLKASISDANIPIQPDGNTNQLQEFDQVYISIYNNTFSLTGGDFWINKPYGYFMNYNKRGQGINGTVSLPAKKLDINATRKEKIEVGLIEAEASFAFSKGVFGRNVIQGVEGNQGPYRLTGNNNEIYIIVLSGTEKVFIDGELLTRGREYDYTIDYNTAEITFTANRRITKDKRIKVEFQYTDQSYSRTLLQGSVGFEKKKFRVYVNAYSESDLKNQPLQQDLSDQDKALLSMVGDSTQNAVRSSVVNIGFNDNQNLYAMIDSLGYDSVLVINTSPDSAIYQVTFSSVGTGNGDYVFDYYSAFGKVYKWVEPVAGVSQGDYAPVRLLTAPVKTQMITAGARLDLARGVSSKFEMALSNKDVNTFSNLDKKNNTGLGLNFNLNTNHKISKDTITPWRLKSEINFEGRGKDFNPIQRYRDVEFQRDWNILTANYYSDQYLGNANIGFEHSKIGKIDYTFKMFYWGNDYQGYKNQLKIDTRFKGLHVWVDGSLLNSVGVQKTLFLRHKSHIYYQQKWLKIGFKDDHEWNEKSGLNNLVQDPLSYQYYDFETYVGTPDTNKIGYRLFYSQRKDWHSDTVNLRSAALAQTFGADFRLTKWKSNIVKAKVSYRKLTIQNAELIDVEPDNTILSRLEYILNVWKGAINWSNFYEIGSGLEQKKEFVYLEVAAGQGVYAWVDYNNDGIKDLNEFELSQFQDQANYIRVFTPSTDYVRVYTNEFQSSINIRPERVLARKKGFLKFVSRLSNQTIFRVNRKTTGQTQTGDIFNPFIFEIADTALMNLNTSFRNSFYFNRTNPVFGFDYTYQYLSSKALIANGFDARDQNFHQLNLRYNISRKFTLKVSGEIGTKRQGATYTSSRNFDLEYYKPELNFSYQPSTSLRLTILAKYTNKLNKSAEAERAQLLDTGVEFRFNEPKKGSLQATFNLIMIEYSGLANTPIAYEMLEGFQNGLNLTWGVSYQRNIAKFLQLSISYNGRSTQGNKVIHTGGMEVRAFF
ncbi:MAG: hypothetical protein R2799_09425 [Crocinitomicaceae bacterium]